MTDRDHYNRWHRGKPHEILVSGPNPFAQQQPTTKNETAYIFLYIALVVGGLLLVIMAYGVWRDHREKSKQRDVDKKKKKALSDQLRKKQIYPNIVINGSSGKSRFTTTTTTSAGSSLPSMSTITEEVQPSSENFPYSMGNNHTHTTTTQQQTRDDLGQHHHRHHSSTNGNRKPQSQSTTTYPDLHQQNSNNLDGSDGGMFGRQFFSSAYPPSTATTSNNASSPAPPSDIPPSSSNSSTTCNNKRRVSRQESFPYEKYGIPPEEREPRTTRVENMRPMSDFFKLTPGESWIEEEEEDIEVGSSSSSSSRRTNTPSTADENSGGAFVHLDEDDDTIQRAFNNADTLPLNSSKRGGRDFS